VPNILIAVPSKKEKLPLSVTHPELAKEADGWDATSKHYLSPELLSWKCKVGHKWISKVVSRNREFPNWQVFTPYKHGVLNRLVPVEDEPYLEDELYGSVYPVLDRDPYVLVEDDNPFELLLSHSTPDSYR
jgi:hypothetical protein